MLRKPLSLAVGIITLFFVTTISVDAASVRATQTQPQTNKIPIKDVKRFTTAISQIKSYYVEPVSDKELFQNAIRGMLEGLDPHSSFLDASEFEELKSATRGEFGGIGIEVTMDDGIIKVVSPIDDTPASKAGIKPGDLIVRIGEVPVKGLTLSDALKKMRGPKGSPIDLTIIRKDEKKPLQFHIVRDVIQIKSIRSKLLAPGYGYIRITHFQMPSAQNLVQSINKLKKQNGGKLKGLLLDLRNNPGGLLDSAVEVSDVFLDSKKLGQNKKIVFTKTRIPGANYTANATPGDALNGAPLVILINEGSASGAEIVAGALQDHKRALLLGEGTFGKGSVQTVVPLDESTAIKLTTALYYTPKGRSIQALGIKPDIVIDDISVQKGNNSNNFKALKEAHLQGHLENGSNKVKKQNKRVIEEDIDLVYKDYQLHTALNILKGLAVTNGIVNKN
ncbi:MAG: S41 family peptidase [Pseudomonadota bacterium]